MTSQEQEPEQKIEGQCRGCGTPTEIRKLGQHYEYCEKCCPHESDYDSSEYGDNYCQGCGGHWRSYDND